MSARILGIFGALFAFNLSAWIWAAIAFQHQPLLLGTALVAYSFGLRHAVDADHIAAIDNVTRKLMQSGERPVSVGLWFSLGHSTVVIVGAMVLAGVALSAQQRLAGIRTIGGVIGTLVSAFFLIAIALVNLTVLRSTYRTFKKIRAGEPYLEEDLDFWAGNSGFLARIFRPMFRVTRRGWHMYPLGMLFGLGFDTATEIGVLAISAAEASRGLGFTSILIFPILFAAGMSLVDTCDNVLMLGAYGWAFVKPIRKLYYNITITAVSVIVALAVGGIEVLGLLGTRVHGAGFFWNTVASLNANFGVLGFSIVALFAFCWVVSLAIYRYKKFDELPATCNSEE